MRCKIREIAIFDEEKNKRSITFSDGLNIITGSSQTGKSALIEIVDYCLFASTSTIPRGKIIDFGALFSIVLEIDHKFIVIGRPSPKSPDWNKIFLKVELLEEMIENIDKTYFDTINPISRRSLREEFGSLFNFNVLDISTEEEFSFHKKGMASFRNITPFLFQHQSLIANKHALFYRFDNREKEGRVIDEFPIFMGWVDSGYYRIKRELDQKSKRLQFLKKEIEEIEKNKNKSKEKIEKFVKDYYQIIGKEYPGFSDISNLIKIARNLPEFEDTSYVIGEYEKKRISLEYEREKLAEKRQQIITNVELLEIASNDVQSYNIDLSNLANRSTNSSSIDHYTCPLCNQKVDSLKEKVEEVKKSRRSLSEDLKKLRNYSIDNSKTIERLNKERTSLTNELITINAEINLLKKASADEKDNLTLKDRAREIKQLIELSLDVTFGDSNILHSDQEIEELLDEINKLSKELEKYNYNSLRINFEDNLARDMNKICSMLDFEEELRPPQLYFDVNNFIFSHTLQNKDAISLSEMGSGANWLACHLSLFLALHKQFAKNIKCSIPSFIFFDQPSQVYFPTDSDFNQGTKGDIRKVTEVYDVILDTLNDIQSESGFMPQVIVTDHADNLPLKKNNFEDYVRKRWRNGEKLI
ncbi:MAG: DUF3732 domain-containing protein [Candidatus Thorarchaeota archaeon]